MLAKENNKALLLMIWILVSPGLFVITYLHKFNATNVSNKNTVKSKGNWRSKPFIKININPNDKHKSKIPKISAKPAIAWL